MAYQKKESELLRIIKKYTEGKATAEEIHFLNLYYENFENQPELLESKSEEERTAIGEDMRVKIMERTVFQQNEKGKVISIVSKNWYKVAAVASVILLLFVGMYFLKPTRSKEIAKNIAPVKPLKNDVAPGGNKAILTLADGSTIVLDSLENGSVAQQGNSKIIKLNDGKLAYEVARGGKQKTQKVAYNTVSTPRGGQYQLTLSDGSKVWLNAASSITFPTAFTGNKREVSITGEAYFEVAHNALMPFDVKVGNIKVKVLGTHFNVNAYDDEDAIKTTLLQGSVKVSKGNEDILIVPGEQARVNKASAKITVKKNIDLEEVVAWKNGLFQFDQAGIKTIMRQIARWYDIDVEFEGGLPDKKYDGKIYRNVNASQVLKILEEGGIHFKIENKKVIVSPR